MATEAVGVGLVHTETNPEHFGVCKHTHTGDGEHKLFQRKLVLLLMCQILSDVTKDETFL